MSLTAPRPWVGRTCRMGVTTSVACLAAGAAACAWAGSISTWPLATAAALVVVLPLAVVLALWLGFGFRGLDAAASRVRLVAALRSRDSRLVVRPFLSLIEIAIVFVTVWRAALFSGAAFRREDLGALVTGAAAVVGLIAAGLVGRAVGFLLTPLAERAVAGQRSWLPLATLGASLAWSAGLVAVVAAGMAVALADDLVAADLSDAIVIVSFSLFFLGGTAVSIFAPWPSPAPRRLRVVTTLASMPGIALAVLGVVGVPDDPATLARASAVPGLGLALDAGRRLTDFDGDGFSSLLAGGDCAGFDGRTHPGARDDPRTSVDESCSGGRRSRSAFRKPDPRFVDPTPLCPSRDCNVLLVVIDSFRADRLTPYGSKTEIMPAIESLARRSVLFGNAYSPGPGTILAVPSMLAGVFDSQLEMDPSVKGPLPVSSRVRLIQEDLQAAGVATIGVLEHIYLDPLNQGWTEFSNPWSRTFYRETTAARQADTSIAFLRKYRDRPFFLYVHFNDPHHDYLLHEGFDRFGSDANGRYASELAFTDAQVGRLLDAAEAEITNRPTLVIVTADHGEALGQHGIRYHNGGLYRELLRVPLVVHHPALAPRRLEEPISLLDLAPTLRNLYGLSPDPQHVGVSLLGALLRGEEIADRTIHHQALYDQGGRYYNLVGITRGPLRLLHDMRRRTWEFYDVSSDPDETRNLAGHDPRFAGMRSEIEGWLDTIGLTASFVHRPWEDAPPGAVRNPR